MSWAARRRLAIMLLVGGILAIIIAIFLYASLHKAPSCFDGIQDGNETGIDCGGSCPYLCTADEEPPTVLFTQALPGLRGTTDVIAEVENKNATAAAKSIPYTITLYGAGRALIQQITGTFDLPPQGSVPVFIPGITSGNQTVTAAFLTIDPQAVKWYSMPTDTRLLPQISNATFAGTTALPRVTALLTDTSVEPLSNIKLVVLVRDGSGNVIGASQTIVPSIGGQGQAIATFTWNAPFATPAVSIEVLPVVPLP